MQPYVVLEKEVGETPLSCAEKWRAAHPAYADVALSYAGRLDPMASGKLLVLIGEECKKQAEYHNLDKAYNFSILFGIGSDTADVLGRLATNPNVYSPINSNTLTGVAVSLIGEITLPYPTFSAKTVQGKPLHMWTLENRLDEIEIPTRTSKIYRLELVKLESLSKTDVCKQTLEKIETIPPVTDPRKALGNDFRRADVRNDWNNILTNSNLPETYSVAHFTCIASSGTYMRTLAEVIAEKLGTTGLAWHIHRTHIGRFNPMNNQWDMEYKNTT